MLLLPLRFKYLTECGADGGPVQERDGLTPALTDELRAAGLTWRGEVKAGVVVSTGIQECFNGVCISFRNLKGQLENLWVLVEANRNSLFVAVSEANRPYVWTAALLNAIGRRDRGRCRKGSH